MLHWVLLYSALPQRAEPCAQNQGLRARSYRMPSRFPFPSIRLVMEAEPGTCNLYRDSEFCSRFSSGRDFEPEYHVKEAVASFLTGCHLRACPTIDLGANNGWVSSYMLSLGATVLSVEPQADFAAALRDSAALNCWAGRSAVFNGFATHKPRAQGRAGFGEPPLERMNMSTRFIYRAGGIPTRLGSSPAWVHAVPVVPLNSILLGHPSKELDAALLGGEGSALEGRGSSPGSTMLCRLHGLCGGETTGVTQGSKQLVPWYELIKIDVDGPEGAWLGHIERLLTTRKLRVNTMIVECHQCLSTTLHRLQSVHGYTIYLLDMHIDRRFIDARGIDVYALAKKDAPLPPYLEELYSIRLMRHVYRLKPNLTLAELGEVSLFRRMYCNQYVFTHEQLLEPRFEHPDALKRPSARRRASGYVPPDDGIGAPA